MRPPSGCMFGEVAYGTRFYAILAAFVIVFFITSGVVAILLKKKQARGMHIALIILFLLAVFLVGYFALSFSFPLFFNIQGNCLGYL